MTVLEIVLACIVAVGVAIALGSFMFKKDTEKETRRRGAAKLAGVLRSLGLAKTPEFLENYAVGDYSGMAQSIADLVRLFVSGDTFNSDAVVAEFGKVFESVLSAKLSTETGRAYVAAKLEDATRPADATVIQDAPKAGVV